MLDMIFFVMTSVFGLGSLAMMINAKNTMHAAIYLALFFSSTSILFALMGASLLGIVQFLVFVGGIIVMVVIAIMLGGSTLEKEKNDFKMFLLAIVFLAAALPYVPAGGETASFGLAEVSQAFSQYGFLATISGLILFSSLVAAIYLLRRDAE